MSDPESGSGGKPPSNSKRVEDWLSSLKDEAEQRAPDVLSAVASTAKDVAGFLEGMADQFRAKQDKENNGGESADEPQGESKAIDEESQGTSGSQEP
jgi:hypothetical protein